MNVALGMEKAKNSCFRHNKWKTVDEDKKSTKKYHVVSQIHYLDPSIKVLRATLRERRFCKVHSPRQPIRSFTVTFIPVASRYEILCPFRTRNPLVVSMRAFCNCTRLIWKSNKSIMYRENQLVYNVSEVHSTTLGENCVHKSNKNCLHKHGFFVLGHAHKITWLKHAGFLFIRPSQNYHISYKRY
jgi:hypothetical protein